MIKSRLVGVIAGLVLMVAWGVGVAEAQPGRGGVPEGVTAHRDVAYVEGGHERQRLDLYLPEGAAGKLPVIVWIHGGAWMGGSKDDAGPAMRFVQEGYAVTSINYRLSQHAVFPAQIHDCKAAIRWLRANAEKYGLDGERIGVWGPSAGGHLAALLGTSGDVAELEGEEGVAGVSSRVQAVVDWFGPTDLTDMGGGWHDEADSPESRLVGGPIQENKEKAATANPITYVTKDDPPFLVMHGDKDTLVILNQSELLMEALKRAEVEAAFVPVVGAGHGGPGFESEGNREMMAAFFAKHLKR